MTCASAVMTALTLGVTIGNISTGAVPKDVSNIAIQIYDERYCEMFKFQYTPISINEGTRNSAMISQFDNMQLLRKIKELEYDWNGYGANPIPAVLIDKMKTLVWTLPIQPEIFPTARETIQFEFDLQNRSHIEFELFQDDSVHVFEKTPSGETRKENFLYDVQKIIEVVSRFYGTAVV